MRNINLKMLLREGARDRALEQFMPLFQKRGIEMTISKLKEALMTKFVTEANIHNLSLESNFYLVGVSRYYFNGDLTSNKRLGLLYPNVRDRFNPEVCQRLDALILILRNAYIDSVGTTWEQPEDFGTLSMQQLLRKYNSKINKELGIDTKKEKEEEPEEQLPEVNNDYTAGKNYTYEILYSYQDAKKYNLATTPGAWCITYGEQHYDAYIKMNRRYGGIHYVVFRQNGYEKIPRIEERDKWLPGPKGLPKPQDTYGNSLICVLQRNDCPEPTYITSRWNHGSGFSLEADHAYTKEEFLNVIGCDNSVLERAYEQWKQTVGYINEKNKKNNSEERSVARMEKLTVLRGLKYAQMLINGGANPFTLKINGLKIGIATTLGWDAEQYKKDKGIEYLTPENAPQKYPFILWTYTTDAEGNETSERYVTVMDKKKIMFDKFLEKYPYTVEQFTVNSVVALILGELTVFFDKRRHTIIDAEGMTKFKHVSRDITWGKTEKYTLVAKSGNQIALLNTVTGNFVKARNGSLWFESITLLSERFKGNTDYRGHIELESFKEGTVLKLVYDSAAGEKYIYDTKTDKFINPQENVPEGLRLCTYQNTPLERYLIYTDSNEEESPNLTYYSSVKGNFLFKSIDTNEFLNIDGVYKFRNMRRTESVLGYVPADLETAYYYDLERNRHLELDGTRVATEHEAEANETSGYIAISLSRWSKATNNPARDYVLGDFWKQCLLYNPLTGTFYHDDINGYVFHAYGTDWSSWPHRLKVYNSSEGDSTYIIPSAKEYAEYMKSRSDDKPLPFDETTYRIHNIIMETLDRYLRLNT